MIIAVGRTGNCWLKDLIPSGKIKNSPVDIGIRVELPHEYTDHLTDQMYEFKLKTEANGLEIRTFCINPSGFVIQEGTLCSAFVNGHSYRDVLSKSLMTNFAVLAKVSFSDMKEPNDFVLSEASKCRILTGKDTMTQKLKDFVIDRKTPDAEIFSEKRLTHVGGIGNLNFALDSRVAKALKEGLRVFAKTIPDLFSDDVYIHGIEGKCYSDKIECDENFHVGDGIYCIGDGSGWTRGLSQAMVSGLIVADIIRRDK